MIQSTRNYLLITLLAWGISGCTQPQTITVPAQPRNVQPSIMTQPLPDANSIKEEILIRNNPDLGDRINVPKNNPTLGVKIGEEPTVDRLNGEIMERIPFPVEEYNAISKSGRSTVSGKIYLINSATENTVLGKNVKLYLNPVTSYSKQWYYESYLGGYKMSPVDKRLYNYLKFTTSNESGEFNFFGIAPGNYYLIGSMACAEECGLTTEETIRLVDEVHVGSGVANIELSKRVP
ncbi:MAG: hypothetical protein IE889_01990 [Campylobacterales bacterium]|nr:hypothetical protein [Campylobacterales bacterium]